MCPPCPRTCVHHVSGPYSEWMKNDARIAARLVASDQLPSQRSTDKDQARYGSNCVGQVLGFHS